MGHQQRTVPQPDVRLHTPEAVRQRIGQRMLVLVVVVRMSPEEWSEGGEFRCGETKRQRQPHQETRKARRAAHGLGAGSGLRRNNTTTWPTAMMMRAETPAAS